MRGSNHMLTAAATGGVIADTLFWMLKSDDASDILHKVAKSVTDFLLPLNNVEMAPWLFIFLGIFLFFVGSLLPDIDTPYSTLGRIIYLPFEHRTWTHAIWLPLVLCIAGIWVRLLFWLGIGTLMHDLWDSASASGIHWFYPVKSNGKPKHLAIYHTNKPSEFIVVGVVLTLAILYTAISFQIVYHFVNISFA